MARASLVLDVTDKQSLGFFLNELREDIRLRLRLHETTDLYKTMKLAREKQKGFSHRLGPGTTGPQFLKGSGGTQNQQKWDGLPSKPLDNAARPGNKTLTQLIGGTKAPIIPIKSRGSRQ